MNKRKLIVNADDFGQSDGINSGIIKAHKLGIVTSASLMVRCPAAAAAAALAEKNPGLGIGLHIDLGEWIFTGDDWEAVYEVVSLESVDSVGEEISNQLDIFRRVMGRAPTHIDSHQHVHQRPLLRPLFLKMAAVLGVNLRGCGSKVNYCGEFYGQLTDGSAYHEAISVDGLKQTIGKLPAGITELACHPGLHNDINTMYRTEREMEVNTLCDPGIKKIIADLEIELCSFEGISGLT